MKVSKINVHFFILISFFTVSSVEKFGIKKDMTHTHNTNAQRVTDGEDSEFRLIRTMTHVQ